MVDAETQTYTSLSEDAHYMVRVIFMVTFRNFLLNGMLKYKAFAPLFSITESLIQKKKYTCNKIYNYLMERMK